MDKCLKNELMDIKSINLPDLSYVPAKGKELDYSHDDVYVFSAFAKPGHHQVLIYDPKNNKAFCKDFMVNLNLREDVFPEFPILEGMNMRKGIKNVFELWRDESQESIE
jgi:hypothetical protein